MTPLPLQTWGRGPQPLLLLHGFTGTSRTFDHLQPWLAPHVSAVAVNLPGHAGVPVPPGGWEAVLDLLANVLRGRSNWCVAGYSQGARLALALAAWQLPQVTSLILESGSPGLDSVPERALRAQADAALATHIQATPLPVFLQEWDGQPLFSSLTVEQQRRRQDARNGHTPAGLAAALHAMGTGTQPSLWKDLPAISVPTLLITGALDVKFTALAQRMSQLLPHASQAVVEGAGHVPHLEQPAVYARHVLHFLQNLPGSGSVP